MHHSAPMSQRKQFFDDRLPVDGTSRFNLLVPHLSLICSDLMIGYHVSSPSNGHQVAYPFVIFDSIFRGNFYDLSTVPWRFVNSLPTKVLYRYFNMYFAFCIIQRAIDMKLLTHCGLVTPHGVIGLCCQWFRWYLGAYHHKDARNIFQCYLFKIEIFSFKKIPLLTHLPLVPHIYIYICVHELSHHWFR